jgi:hypothetical protein
LREEEARKQAEFISRQAAEAAAKTERDRKRKPVEEREMREAPPPVVDPTENKAPQVEAQAEMTEAKIADITRGFTLYAHPLDVNHALLPEYLKAAAEISREMQLAQPLPKLCTLVTASPVDAAIHDAFGKLHGRNSFTVCGKDFVRFDLSHYLNQEFRGEYLDPYILRKPVARIRMYHSVGASDPLTAAEVTKPIHDGLPETLEDWIPYNGVTAIPVSVGTYAVTAAFTSSNPNYGNAVGIAPHFLVELFKIKTGLDIVHVPYRGGAPMIADLLGSQIQMTINGKSVLLPHIREGKLRPIGVTAAARWPELPDVPTLVEGGYLDFPYDTLFGIVAPAGTPGAVIARLNTSVNDALAAPDIRASFARLGIEGRSGTPADFAAAIAQEAPKWAEIVRLTGIKAE